MLFCANFVSCWFSSLSASTRWSNYNFPIIGSPAKCRLNCRRASRFHAGIYSYLYRCYFWKKERYFFCPPVQTHCSRGLFGIPTPCFLLVEKYVSTHVRFIWCNISAISRENDIQFLPLRVSKQLLLLFFPKVLCILLLIEKFSCRFPMILYTSCYSQIDYNQREFREWGVKVSQQNARWWKRCDWFPSAFRLDGAFDSVGRYCLVVRLFHVLIHRPVM